MAGRIKIMFLISRPTPAFLFIFKPKLNIFIYTMKINKIVFLAKLITVNEKDVKMLISNKNQFPTSFPSIDSVDFTTFRHNQGSQGIR